MGDNKLMKKIENLTELQRKALRAIIEIEEMGDSIWAEEVSDYSGVPMTRLRAILGHLSKKKIIDINTSDRDWIGYMWTGLITLNLTKEEIESFKKPENSYTAKVSPDDIDIMVELKEDKVVREPLKIKKMRYKRK